MKKLIVVAAVVVAALVVWKVAFAKSPAFLAYQNFATAVVRGGASDGAPFCEGEAVQAALKDRWSYTPPMMEAFHGAQYKVESRTKSADGQSFTVLQTVSYTPPGTESALRGTMASRFRHRVTVAKKAGGWKVVSFQSTPVKTVEGR